MNAYRLLERLGNPLFCRSVPAGLGPHCFAVLETTGRRTGLARRTPVGNGLVAPDTFWVVAEHGRSSGYVRNLIASPAVRVCVRGRWRSGVATIDNDDDPLDRRASIDRANGLMGRFDGVVFRASATTPVSIRVALDPVPALPTR